MNKLRYRLVLGAMGLVAGLASVALTAVLYLPRLVQAQTTSTFPHKPSTLVRSGPTIFLVGKGYKQGFASLNEFLTYNYRLSRIVAANEADKQLVEGPTKRAKPGSLVLDILDHRTVYLIGKQGEKRGLATPAAYWRYKKKNMVLWSIDVSGYPMGDIIE